MASIKTAALTLAAFLILMPLSASAHEVQVFEIGGKHYQFVVGSLNEPIAVDDKTGVDLEVTQVAHEETAHGEDHHGTGASVSGLEETLKVELIAGDKKKTLSLSPVYNTPGAYKAVFYPTVATSLSYRFFGTLNNTPVDLTFTCNPAGHEAEEDTTETEISEGVVRVSKTGAFGCPAPKEALGFPEESASIASLSGGSASSMTSIGISVLALLLAGYAVSRKK